MQRLTLLSFSLKNDWEKPWDRTAVPRSRNPDVNSIGVGEASWGLFLLGAVEYVAIISSSLLARSELVEQREGITEWPLHEVSICVLCLLTKHPIFPSVSSWVQRNLTSPCRTHVNMSSTKLSRLVTAPRPCHRGDLGQAGWLCIA